MTPRFLNGLYDVMADYDGYLVDLWGVIHDGVTLYPGVQDCLIHLKEAGKEVVFLSNAPRRSGTVAGQLHALGIDSKDYSALYTSGEDAYEALKTGGFRHGHYGRRAFVLSAKAHMALYDDLDLVLVPHVEDADVLMNTGPQILAVDDFLDVLKAAHRRHLPMICVNPDIQVISAGQPILCAGALALAYTQMGGRVDYHGKPYQGIYDRVLNLFSTKDHRRILAIGDSLETDIRGAIGAGLDSALVMTGLHRRQMVHGDAPSVAAERRFFEKKCQESGVMPTYIVGGFSL